MSKPIKLRAATPEEIKQGGDMVIGKEATIKGSGNLSYSCSGCGRVLIENIAPGQVSDLIIKCEACGAHSVI